MEINSETVLDSDTSIVMLTNQFGLLGTYIASSEKGSYSVFTNPSSGKGHILFYDYSTMTLDYLCDDRDKGIIDSVVGGAFPIYYNDEIYIIKYGFANYDAIPTVIYKYSLDGVLKSTFVLPNDKMISSSSRIGAVGKELLLLTESYDKNTNERKTVQIESLDIDNQSMKTITSLSNDGNYQIVGSYENILVLDHYRSIDSEKVHDLLTFSLDEKSMSAPFLSWASGNISYCIVQDKVYFVAEESLLRSVDIISEDQEDVYDFSSISTGLRIVGNIDNRILFQQYKSGEFGLWFNSISKEMGHLQLSVGILGQTENCYFVSLGEKIIPYEQEIQGKLVQGNLGVVNYALISKDDFWNNTPNFIVFDDHIYNSNMIFLENEDS